MRVAVVLEQCWHRVPGGTALAALRQVEAVTEAGGVDQVGVAARHSSPPRPAYRPSIPVEHLALPRRVLYESWHRARWPKVERATGPVDAIHATGYAVPPASAPLVSTMHDLAWRHDPGNFTKNGVMFFESGLKRVVEDAALVLCPSQATLDDCAAAGIGHERLRRIPWGMTVTDVDADEVERAKRSYGLDGRYILFVGTVEPRKNLPRLLEAVARLPHEDVTLAVADPDWRVVGGWWPSVRHAPPDVSVSDRHVLCGHVHPVLRLPPLGRHPLFWLRPGITVLPAFSAFTGGHPVPRADSAGSVLCNGRQLVRLA